MNTKNHCSITINIGGDEVIHQASNYYSHKKLIIINLLSFYVVFLVSTSNRIQLYTLNTKVVCKSFLQNSPKIQVVLHRMVHLQKTT